MNVEAKPQLEQSTQEKQIRTALDQHWAASDANDFETELSSNMRTRCSITRSQANEHEVDATYRTSALVSRAKSGFLSGESLATVIFGSPNSS
jgi:uncharacterized lipoprotein YmbA